MYLLLCLCLWCFSFQTLYGIVIERGPIGDKLLDISEKNCGKFKNTIYNYGCKCMDNYNTFHVKLGHGGCYSMKDLGANTEDELDEQPTIYVTNTVYKNGKIHLIIKVPQDTCSNVESKKVYQWLPGADWTENSTLSYIFKSSNALTNHKLIEGGGLYKLFWKCNRKQFNLVAKVSGTFTYHLPEEKSSTLPAIPKSTPVAVTKKKTSLVPILLACLAVVLIVLVIVLVFVYKRYSRDVASKKDSGSNEEPNATIKDSTRPEPFYASIQGSTMTTTASGSNEYTSIDINKLDNREYTPLVKRKEQLDGKDEEVEMENHDYFETEPFYFETQKDYETVNKTEPVYHVIEADN